ncbi:hypothetical protein ACHAXR_013450 [Thalassiosira sp. AJA248-18]
MRFCTPLTILCTSSAAAFSPGSSDTPFSLSAYQKARAKETSKQLDASRFHFQILFVDNNNFHARIAEGMMARIAEYNSDTPFSLSAYQKARAKETSKQLDASRFHFQILFVDNNNFHARIAEGMMARIAEYNDALFTLFPYSATIEASPKAPIDPAAPQEAVAICDSLGLCLTTCSDDGTSFNLSDLDQYDLIIAVDDEIQNLILRSLPPSSEGYENKCRSLSEFLSVNFCGVENSEDITTQTIQDMIEPGMWEKAEPYYKAAFDSSSSSSGGGDIFSESKSSDVYNPRMILNEHGAAIPNQSGWPLVEAAMLVACAGITRFCLDTIDAQFDQAFAQLLGRHFYRREHLDNMMSIEDADDQLRLGSLSVTGYFSPKERHARIRNHFEELRSKFESE